MDYTLKKFLDWASKKLRHLPPPQRQKVLDEIAYYLTESQSKQNVPYRSLINSLGDRIQFINGFLLRLGESPLTPTRGPLRMIFKVLALLTALGVGSLLFLYYYLSSQFNFDLNDGKIKLFGQIIDMDHMDLTYETNNFPKKYIRRQSPTDPKAHFIIKLEETKSTILYHGKNSYTVECEIEPTGELSLDSKDSKKKKILIHVRGNSNCDLTLPQAATVLATFKRGRMTIERPSSSFRIEGENGHITWIKNLKSKFKIFYDVQNAATQGNFKDIFHPNASQEAHIKLQSGNLSFIGP